MAKFCTNCGNELEENATTCPNCGKEIKSTNTTTNNIPNNGKESNGMAIAGFILSFFVALLGLIFSIIGLKKSKQTNSGRGLSIAGIIISSLNMLLGIILVAVSGFAVFSAITDAENEINKDNYNRTNDWNTDKNTNTKYTLGDTIDFDKLEITFDNNYTFTTIDNNFSEHYNNDVVKIGVNIKNNSSETHNLNMFYYSLFGSKGTELDKVSAYFDESVDYAGDLKPGASYYKYFYILYDGDGKYSIDFDNYYEELSVEFDVKK